MGLRLGVAGVFCAALLSACGSSATPSAGNPAPLAPAGTVFYLELTVRPQGAQQQTAESGLTRLLGHSPDAGLRRLVNKAFRRSGLEYSRDFKPWLGQKIALVVTSFTRGGFALIAPTNDPAEALSTMRRGERHSHLIAASYAGVRYQTGVDNGTQVAMGVVGSDAVVGGPRVFKAIVDAYHGRSLLGTPSFSAALAALPSDALLKAYVDATGARAAIRGLLASHATLPLRSKALLGTALARLRGAVSFSMSVASRALTLRLHSSPPRGSAPGDVSGLPEASWLALDLSTSRVQPDLAPLRSAVAGNSAAAAALAQLRSRLGIDVLGDVVPALGPLELSVQGTSAAQLAAGLAVTPDNLPAATRLLAALHRLAQRSSSLSVAGTGTAFAITKAGLPIPRVLVALVGHRLLATFDESFGQLLTPSARLSANPDFAHALASVPVGSRVTLFLDFRQLDSLLSQLPGFASNPREQKSLRVLARLDYLVLAESPSASDTQLVLSLR